MLGCAHAPTVLKYFLTTERKNDPKGSIDPPRRIDEIVHGKWATALRLGAFFGVRVQSRLDLQAHYDAETARDAMPV
jgi:hypothetical protein